MHIVNASFSIFLYLFFCIWRHISKIFQLYMCINLCYLIHCCIGFITIYLSIDPYVLSNITQLKTMLQIFIPHNVLSAPITRSVKGDSMRYCLRSCIGFLFWLREEDFKEVCSHPYDKKNSWTNCNSKTILFFSF